MRGHFVRLGPELSDSVEFEPRARISPLEVRVLRNCPQLTAAWPGLAWYGLAWPGEAAV